ncbi:hypothetical protein PAPYR_7425 [Paratrimastix pyriformis]|uniref:Uncharacterized protein n=1 Tax=Paratrimastix pyriformis TaxID=342808 RepID=A0ABQ8UD10_9EUKA|nr:hypothetical protein PAPYR_7425 [Paratrimastix pyriformis]
MKNSTAAAILFAILCWGALAQQAPEEEWDDQEDEYDPLLFGTGCRRVNYHERYGLHRVNVGRCKGECPSGGSCVPNYQTRLYRNRAVKVVTDCSCNATRRGKASNPLEERVEEDSMDQPSGDQNAALPWWRSSPCHRVSKFKGHGVNEIDVGECKGSCDSGYKCTPIMEARQTRGGWTVMTAVGVYVVGASLLRWGTIDVVGTGVGTSTAAPEELIESLPPGLLGAGVLDAVPTLPHVPRGGTRYIGVLCATQQQCHR